MSDTPPVLLLIFNRPDITREVMAQIREAEPPKLFVGADGPRADQPDEADHCEQARQVATHVDWNCEVHTLFRDENMGCKQAVSSAITWFFEHVEAGIILEDDCIPHPTFFSYCAELLERYREDERVMVISGDNFQPPTRTYDSSYYFSTHMHCWGWATWRRAWKKYDGQVSVWHDLRGTGWLEGWLGSEDEAEYWQRIFDKVYREEVDSWAYPWTFTCWKEHGLTILPAVNLVSNIGFDVRATHTDNENSDRASLSTKPLSFPLDHPIGVCRDYKSDRYTSRQILGICKEEPSRIDSLKRMIGSVKLKIEKITKVFVEKVMTKAYGVDPRWRNWGVPANEVSRLKNLPRRKPGQTKFRGNEVKFADSTTFLQGIREIFGKDIYFFGEQSAPLIIDCGANIGHSVLYFKERYPNARVEAYEPDPSIFEMLSFNVDSFGLDGVSLHNSAVWKEEGVVEFQREGGFSGRIPMQGDTEQLIEVDAVPLETILENRHVDFLKLDIEGAEHDVLTSCTDSLHNVDYLFVEYHSHEDTRQGLHEILEIMCENGFRYHVHEAYTRAQPYIDTETMLGMDLQLNIFGIQSGRVQ